MDGGRVDRRGSWNSYSDKHTSGISLTIKKMRQRDFQNPKQCVKLNFSGNSILWASYATYFSLRIGII